MNTQQSTPKSIFLDAVEIADSADRKAYIAAQCGADEKLRSEVEALMRHHQQLGGFLNTGPANHAATMDLPQLTEGRGSVIGPYKLLEQIGEAIWPQRRCCPTDTSSSTRASRRTNWLRRISLNSIHRMIHSPM
jgi:hypothetical protein